MEIVFFIQSLILIAPVLVWIYGGGFVGGEKSSSSPATLLERSLDNGDQGIVFVALNYRLGLYVRMRYSLPTTAAIAPDF